MLERGHRLKVGETGIVGYVAKHGVARIALDVGKDAVYFDNPDLPLTRSEVALPLLFGSLTTGVLDVQSTQGSAFTEEDVALLSTLADQVAIAIENAHLFSEINQRVQELQSVQRQYLQQEWHRIITEQTLGGYTYAFGKVSPLPGPQPWQTTEGLETTLAGNSKEAERQEQLSASKLSIPITLRGQEIGAFNLEEIDGDRQWSQEEIALVKTIADQVGSALENARLLEVTQRRAARDRMVAEITDKMRRAVDMDSLIQTAVREITDAIGVPEAFVQLGVSRANQNDNEPQPSSTQEA
jgi:GAF domain-containing protein